MKKNSLYPKITLTCFALISSLLSFNLSAAPQSPNASKGSQAPKPKPPQPHAAEVFSAQSSGDSDKLAADYAELYVNPVQNRDPAECPNDDPGKLVNPTVRVSFRVIEEGAIGEIIVRCIALDDTIFLSKSDLIFDRWGPKGSELAKFNSFQLKNGTLEGGLSFGAGLAFAFNPTNTSINPAYEPGLDASEQSDALLNDSVIESYYHISFKSDCKYESNNPLCPSYKIWEENYIYAETIDAYGEVFVEGKNTPLYYIDKNTISNSLFHKPNQGVFKIFLYSL